MADLTFRVKAHSENPTKTIAKARGFEVVIDEPVEMGGTNAGPNPIEYLLATLAGCLNVMGHTIAKEMNMNLNGLKINISGILNPDKFSGVDTDERAGLKQINVEIIPDTDADEATLEKFHTPVPMNCRIFKLGSLSNISFVNCMRPNKIISESFARLTTSSVLSGIPSYKARSPIFFKSSTILSSEIKHFESIMQIFIFSLLP
jgi:uncharacterized OsmC-like protein